MAETALPLGAVQEQWDDDYFKEYMAANWFRKFMGKGSSFCDVQGKFIGGCV